MPVKFKNKPATAAISEEIKDKGVTIAEEKSEEVVEVPAEVTKPAATRAQLCEVAMEASYTHNLGDYKSARVGVYLMIPCRPSEIDQVYDYIESWVDKRMGDLKSNFE